MERTFTWDDGKKTGVLLAFEQRIPREITAVLLRPDGKLEAVPLDQLTLQQ
jgi:hypothetical protein